MTDLHRAGLAGLFMTLKAFDNKNVKISGLEWELTSTTVKLIFKDDNLVNAFNDLVKYSFQIDDDGFFLLPGTELYKPFNQGKRYQLYEALRGTFLQFGPHCKTEQKRALLYELDGKQHFIREFAPLKWYKHQDAAKDFLNSKGTFKKFITVKGWLFPGGVERHSALANTYLSEPPELALCLLYAPIGVVYYRLNSVIKGRKARVAMVIPTIKDLEEYYLIRFAIATGGSEGNVFTWFASGPIDAGMRYLLTEGLRKNLATRLEPHQVSGCIIVTFGIVPWNEKQKTRTYVRRLSRFDPINFEIYSYANAIFKDRWQLVTEKKTKSQTIPEHYFLKLLTAREIIAENCAAGRQWYSGFAKAFSTKEVREQLIYERKEMANMLEAPGALSDQERNYVLACQEAWKRRLGQLGGRAEKEKTNFTDLVQRERTRMRVAIVKCKTAESLRECIIDFWSRAGSLSTLQDNWEETFMMFDEQNWKKARDLALLALVSYRPLEATSNDKDAPDKTVKEEGDIQ